MGGDKIPESEGFGHKDGSTEGTKENPGEESTTDTSSGATDEGQEDLPDMTYADKEE